jgi:hypothetical protein
MVPFRFFLAVIVIGVMAGFSAQAQTQVQPPAPALIKSALPTGALAPGKHQISPDSHDDANLDDLPPLYPEMTPQAEKLTQDNHVRARQQENAMPGSFQWMSWAQAGDKVHELVLKESKDHKQFDEYGRYIDIAVADVDKDGLPDVIVYYWNYCPSQGCPYEVYFGNSNKNVASFIGNRLIPYRDGVKLDDQYYEL